MPGGEFFDWEDFDAHVDPVDATDYTPDETGESAMAAHGSADTPRGSANGEHHHPQEGLKVGTVIAVEKQLEKKPDMGRTMGMELCVTSQGGKQITMTENVPAVIHGIVEKDLRPSGRHSRLAALRHSSLHGPWNPTGSKLTHHLQLQKKSESVQI